MMQLISFIFTAIGDIMIMVTCLKRISNQTYFKYFNRNIWTFIVIVGAFFGQIAYLMMECSSDYR